MSPYRTATSEVAYAPQFRQLVGSIKVATGAVVAPGLPATPLSGFETVPPSPASPPVAAVGVVVPAVEVDLPLGSVGSVPT
jgi:hypothetical protein